MYAYACILQLSDYVHGRRKVYLKLWIVWLTLSWNTHDNSVYTKMEIRVIRI